jgi:hypothetical protein
MTITDHLQESQIEDIKNRLLKEKIEESNELKGNRMFLVNNQKEMYSPDRIQDLVLGLLEEDDN